jgi:hypothetical protein
MPHVPTHSHPCLKIFLSISLLIMSNPLLWQPRSEPSRLEPQSQGFCAGTVVVPRFDITLGRKMMYTPPIHVQANADPIIANPPCIVAGKGGHDGWDTQPV